MIRPGRSHAWRRVAVAVLVLLNLALALAHRWGGEGPWWLELARYLPYPLLLAPAALALVLSYRLPIRHAIASIASLALAAILVAGFVWNPATDRGERAAGGFRLMTWNAKALHAVERPFGIDALAAEIVRHDPDLVVMQDASKLRQFRAEGGTGSLFGYPHFFHFGQFIVASRLPLRDCAPEPAGDAPYRFDVVRCTVDAPGGALQLVTVHFESPRSGLTAARPQGIDGIEVWQRNHELRLAQADALARLLQAGRQGLPLVVAGDLNAPPSSPVVARLLATGLDDAFARAGRGFGHTYGHILRPAFSFLRIDHVLTSRGIAVDDAFVGGKDASDHRPVIADLRRSGK